MGPRSKVAFKYWLLRGQGGLLAKTRKNELLTLKVWEKSKLFSKRIKATPGIEPGPLGWETATLSTRPQRILRKNVENMR